MIDLATTPEYIEGGIVGVISVISILFHLKCVDSRLMACERPLRTTLNVTHDFRLFVTIFVACSLIAALAILDMGLAGTTSELLFALLVSTSIGLMVGYLVIQVFLTTVYISGDKVTMRSPFGQKQVILSQVTAISINGRFQFELSDGAKRIRFCHLIEGKRPLIEHMIERAPMAATEDLQEYLANARAKKLAAAGY